MFYLCFLIVSIYFFCYVFLLSCYFFLMIRRPPRSTRTDTLFPYTTLCRSLNVFQPLTGSDIQGNSDIDMIMDIPVQLSVELGRTRLTIKNILQLRSEEHKSELQSLMRNSYAVFCLKKKKMR